MGCVNKSSKEFKDLASRHNLDTNALELIVHKYWLETGNEILFPTDIYIQSQLGNTQYQEDGESVRKLWQMKYGSPLEYHTIDEYQRAYNQAAQYFPKSAIVHYKNTKGSYVLSVKKPVKSLNKSKASYFSKADRMLNTGNEKTLNLSLEDNKSYGIGKILELYNRFNKDRTSKDLADKVFDIAKQLNLNITFNDTFTEGKLGRYVNENKVTYRKSFFENDALNNLKAPVILHELLHAVSMYALSDDIAERELSKPLQKFKIEMNSLYQDLKNHPLLKDELGITSVNEFVAELSNPVFRDKLQEIDKQNKSKEVKSFWSRVLDAFKHLLGLHVTNSYYERSMNALDKALDAFDIDTYMRYNQVKSQLRSDISNMKVPQNSKAKRFLKTLSPTQKEAEIRQIRREEADYDLINGKEQPQKKSPKAVPQDFTFADGTTIKSPFKPNEQQEEALNTMDRFIKSKDTSMTLSGYAGTGKTSLMEMIAKKCRKQGKPVMFCATTNKAAAVLDSRVSKAGFKATTLNKTFGINVEVDSSQKSYNARNLVNVLKDVDIMPGTTIIIDEASMINEENYRILNDIAKDNNLKIIYVGDEAQLAPVNEDQISKVFRNGDGKVITLTQVERTDDNAILKEATNIRNGKPLSGETSFNSKGEGVAYISPQHQDAINEVVSHYVKGLKRDPNYFKILAYTNKAVSDYNTQVRSLLGYDSPIPQVGEPMTGYANWGYDWRTKSYRFINSESYKVTKVGNPRNKSILLDDGRQVSLEAVPITLEDSLGHRDEFEFMDIKSNPQNRQAAMVLAEEKKKLWAMTKRVYGRAAKAELFQRINSLDSFLFVNDNLEDNDHNLLQSKTIDFGYALTIHKSQGSTFTNVLMDDVDVSKSIRSNNSFDTVDLGDTTLDPANAEIESMETVDLGDLSNVVPESEDTISASSTSNVANIKQQLEYVGVSRATDTVTIISNKTKKEGTPIHPNREIKEDSPMTLKDLETKIQSDSIKMKLSDDEKYYVDEEGNKYARVTSVITTGATHFDPNSPWALPSSKVGTGVDVFVRDFFDGNIGDSNTLSKRYPNATQEQLKKLYDDLQEIKNSIDGKYTIVSKDVTLKGQIPIMDKDGNVHNLNVAGTVDLLIYDNKGNFYIYDMKTHHSNKELYKDPEKLYRYTRQVSLYKILFENQYPGHTVEKLALMPIHVEYPTPKGFGDGTAEYTATTGSNQLYINGKEFKNANPILEKTIPVSPLDVEIHYEDLTDEVKELIDSNSTIKENTNRSNNVNNNNVNNGTEYKQTDEFRRVQEAVRKGSQGQQRSVLGRNIPRNRRQDLANVLGRQLRSINSFIHGSSRNVINEKHSISFKLHSEVNPQLFHDIFEVVRYYTENAELVDLQNDYTDCKCYLSEDGTAGFAVEPDGNLISVFNLGTTKGFLRAIKDVVREAGATHLDAYASSKQNLEHLYKMTLGFHTASTMDYNMEYDHDDIAKNHGNPQIVFMVDHEVENPKHFDKNSYDEAKHYQMTQLNNTKQEENEEPKVENPTFEQGKTFTVKLPSYEYFNDLYEDTTVDAEWKIPYLQQLDSQINDDNTTEENQDIINQMNTIMDATSEKEYNQQLKDPKEVKKTLSEYERFIQQLDNLLEGGNEDYDEFGAKINASEVRHTAELIINEVSDEITRLQTEEGRAKEIFPEIKTKIDFKTATRRQIVDAIGINTLLDRVKNLFDSETAMYDDDVTSLQADLITENWDAFINMAADVFALNEGFGITKDYSKGNFTTTDEAKADFDNFNDYSNDPDVVAEEGEKDEQEHWQVEMKTIDVLNSMSDLVRQGLRECYLLDEKGEKVMSKWGIAERVNPRKATNSILRWTQGSMSLDDMIAKLSDKSTKNPWLSQLVDKLSDKSGKYTDFQSQFYGVFQKHFQPYSIVVTENDKYHSMLVNSHPALSDAMKTITSKFKTQTHPLFIGNMIKKEALGNESTIGGKHDFNLHKALSELQSIVKSLSEGNTLDEDMSNKAKENILGVCRLMGYDLTEDALSDIINEPTLKKEAEYLKYMVNDLDKAYEAQHQGKLQDYNPFAYGIKNGIDGSLRNFLTPITDVMEDTAVSAFYDSGKMYQSYVTPSFMTKLMNKFKFTGQEFRDFMMGEYASSEWFAFDKFGDYNRIQWRNEWLRLLQNEDARKVFAHKVELNFNKHNYMRNMTDAEYTISLITEYFSESADRTKDKIPAWFRIPMQSNKPSSDFIKFYSYRGKNYKTSITNNLYEMFLQELSRIQTVRMRNLGKKDAGFIKNFDTNGRKFNFLPVFNAYLENTPTALAARNRLHNTVEYDGTRLMELQLRYDEWEKGDILGTFKDTDEYDDLLAKKEINDRSLTTEEDTRFTNLLQKKLNGEEALSSVEEAQLGKLALKIIRQSMENRVQSILDSWEASGILESAKDIKNIYPVSLDDEGAAKYVRSQVENFLWNDALASKNILQLTIGDIAFYKDTEDLQKRLAQLHAPGMRGNIYATDYKGNRVSDGKYRTFILNDFDTFKSNLIANISEVFDRKITAAPDDQKPAMEALKESLVGADGKYTHINVTDAQGYSSPTSYRKKAFIFGRWSHQAEDIYQQLKNGKYTFTDLETAFQPLKPFVYTKLTKNMGVDNAPIHSMQVPFQAKNAEYLLIMADALLQGENLLRPNLLRAIYRVMEDSETLNPTMGIDTVQFESAIKSGLQGTINISQFMDMPNGEEAAYTYMKNLIYKDGSNEYNKDVFVHETSFDDYCIQQEVPEHFKEHSQAHGSQIRMITPSDLDFYTTDKDGNQVDNYYSWTEPDGTVKRLKTDEFRKEYEQTIADNIEDSINELQAELHLDSLDKKERNVALSKILIKEVLSSPRYGVDLMQACALNSDGEFRIPKGDPIQAKRIEQLINSIIKNRVNKQKIAGGPIVQVSNFGTSKQLHIRFNDKQGNLLPMESEYVPSEHGNLSYKDYIKENQGGIAYFEVFAPIWSNEIFDKFSNPDGSINIDAINAIDPELLKMVSYRIPTEDKYSCAPMKVVGFMPREAGDAIMLPYELTEIDDSDFDVDKRYVMRKDIPIKTKEDGEYVDQLIETGKKLYKEIMGTEATAGSVAIGDKSDYVEKMVDSLVKNPAKFPKNSPFRKALYSEYQKLAYKTEAPLSGRGYRDNKIIDMTYAVLTNEMTADKILNPGGFDAPKKMGYMVAAYKNHANEGIKWSDLENMSIDELKKLSYTDKDLTFADTQVQFYKQNSAAASLIGVFAVNKVAHATLESNGIYLDVAEICGDKPFTIADTTFEGKMEIDMKYDQNRTLIGKTLGSLVSASADAVKDPILNLMNVNMTTAGMLNTMLRFGMPFNDAALFLSQDIIERLLTQFNRENLTNYVSLDSLITKWLDKYREQNDITDSSALNTEPLTRNELIEGLKSSEHEEIDYKVLLAFQKMRILTDYMRKPTFATRFNSISSAVGPLIIDNLITEHKRDAFKGDTQDTHFYTLDGSNTWVPYSINDTFQAHPVLAKFAETLNIAKGMFMDMPTGSNGFRGLLNKLPKDIQDKMYGDKKLMDQFSNFYQSYLLIQSGVVDPSRLSYYIKDFPKKFMAEKWNEKYPDNLLIQAIRMNVDSKSKNPYLIINITGMDEQQKEELKYGWIDLHKVEPQLSQDLFNYSFFRAGIGFSPKTFMALVPTYVKERLKSADSQSSYVDTYRNFPEVVSELVIDQFIRNNWSNTKLAPWKGGKNTHYLIDEKQGTLLVSKAEEIKDVKDFSYIKTSKNKVTYLWHQEGQTTDGVLFRRVKPLGNNGEYLEMDTSDIVYPMSATIETSKDETPSPMKEVSPEESNVEETPTSVTSDTQEAKNLSELADLIMKQVSKLNREQALNKIEEMKGSERLYRKFLQNVFKQKGLTLDEHEAINEFKKYC